MLKRGSFLEYNGEICFNLSVSYPPKNSYFPYRLRDSYKLIKYITYRLYIYIYIGFIFMNLEYMLCLDYFKFSRPN